MRAADAAEQAARRPQWARRLADDQGRFTLRNERHESGCPPELRSRAALFRRTTVRGQQPAESLDSELPGRAHCDGYWPAEAIAAEGSRQSSGTDAPARSAAAGLNGRFRGKDAPLSDQVSTFQAQGAAAFVVTEPSWLEGTPPPVRTGPVGRLEQVQADVKDLWPSLRRDVRDAANWRNAFFFSAATAAAIAIHQDWDGKVREYTAQHPERWGDASVALGRLGQPEVQLPVLFGAYGFSVWIRNDQLHEVSLAAMNAYALTTAATVLLKAAVNSKRPTKDWNGGQFGFPSYHTSSSFTFAAVLDEYYGPQVGLPALALAGLIGWSRLDERDHDLSDVLFGAALGYVIGKSVAKSHRKQAGCVDVAPFSDPDNHAAGVTVKVRF